MRCARRAFFGMRFFACQFFFIHDRLRRIGDNSR